MRRILGILVLLVGALVFLPPLYYTLFPRDVPELPPPGRRIRVAEGLSVNAVERGAGPPVVLVHGLPGSAYDWTPLTVALAARGRRVIAYDRVGFGRSDPRRDDDFTVEANARELLGLLESEDLREATIVGWSYGGGTAIVASRLDPSRIARLVLVGSAGPWEDAPEPPAFYAILFSGPVQAWTAKVPPFALGLQRVFSQQGFSEQAQPDWWLPQLAANFAAGDTRRTYSQEGRRFDPDALDPSTIDRPILVIHGDDDRLAPLPIGRELHRRARRSEILVVKGGSHMLPLTHTELLADRIVAFSATP